MRLKLLALIFIGSFLAGCGQAQSASDDPDIVYPSGKALQFPEEQVIKIKLEVTTDWQTVKFDKPLKINQEGLQGLHLAVDQKLYISTMDDSPLNPECNEPGCEINAFCLRRLSDGALVRPEVILVGDNGDVVKIRPDGHLYPYFDKKIMTVAMRTFKDVDSPPPDFPKGITAFTSMRIRSTEPFLVRYLWWNVDRHPDMFSK